MIFELSLRPPALNSMVDTKCAFSEAVLASKEPSMAAKAAALRKQSPMIVGKVRSFGSVAKPASELVLAYDGIYH